jgi:branched-subunit amino acid aminotransferase/4-amino-4-deoxychorismate lyase
MRGYGVFELFRTYETTPFYLSEHLQRLKRGAKMLKLNYPEEIETILNKLFSLNRENDLVYKIYLSETENEKDELLIIAEKLIPPILDEKSNGISIILNRNLRVFPEIKTTSYLAAIRALKDAKEVGASDALYVNEKDELLELTRANFFCVMDSVIYTPKNDILEGITRKVVIELANELKLPIKTTTIYENQISDFEEAFATSTTKEILPIKKIGPTSLKIGPVTKKLMIEFRRMIKIDENKLATTFHF